MQDFLRRGLLVALFASVCLTQQVAAEVSVPSGSYSVDPTHGYINLSYSHLGFSHPTIRVVGFDADLTLDADKMENSKVKVSMEAGSLDSGVEKFNGHLVGKKFFNADKYPSISFVSTGVKDKGDGMLAIDGDLTIKGITKPVSMDAKLNKAGTNPMKKVAALGFSASTTIMRSDWDLGEHAPMVSDEVDISIEIEFLHNK